MTDLDLEQARNMLKDLQESLRSIVKKDPEQEVQTFAIPILDAALNSIKKLISDDAIAEKVRGLINVETIERGEPLRAVEVSLVVDVMLNALPKRRMPRGAFWTPETGRRP
jgi:uncharacterized membrane-anchored protein YjiN (DUF445 family)